MDVMLQPAGAEVGMVHLSWAPEMAAGLVYCAADIRTPPPSIMMMTSSRLSAIARWCCIEPRSAVRGVGAQDRGRGEAAAGAGERGRAGGLVAAVERRGAGADRRVSGRVGGAGRRGAELQPQREAAAATARGHQSRCSGRAGRGEHRPPWRLPRTCRAGCAAFNVRGRGRPARPGGSHNSSWLGVPRLPHWLRHCDAAQLAADAAAAARRQECSTMHGGAKSVLPCRLHGACVVRGPSTAGGQTCAVLPTAVQT
jgi:hypothetical protein